MGWATHGLTTHMRNCKLTMQLCEQRLSCAVCYLDVTDYQWAHANTACMLDPMGARDLHSLIPERLPEVVVRSEHPPRQGAYSG